HESDQSHEPAERRAPEAQEPLLVARPDGRQRHDEAGDDGGVDARIVEADEQDVADQRGQRALDGEAYVLGIRGGVGDQEMPAGPCHPPESPRTVCATARSLASSSRCSRVNGSPGASMSCTPRLTASPSATHSQSQSTNSMRPSGGSGAMSGTTITRDAGTP